MKFSELEKMVTGTRAYLNAFHKHTGIDPEVEVWLPGSYIALQFNDKALHAMIATFDERGKPNKLLIEGNLKPGSALIPDDEQDIRKLIRKGEA